MQDGQGDGVKLTIREEFMLEKFDGEPNGQPPAEVIKIVVENGKEISREVIKGA